MCQDVSRDFFGRMPSRSIGPIIWIDPVADRDESHVLRNLERPHLVGCIGLLVNRIRRPHQCSADSHQTRKESLGQVQLHFHVCSGDIAHIGMREGVVPNRIAFAVNSLRDAGKLVGLDSNQEKSRSCILGFQDIENLRSPFRVRAVVECDRHFVGTITVTSDAVWFGQVLEHLVGDHLAAGVDGQIAGSMRRPLFDAQNFALAFHVDVGTGRHILEFVGRSSIAGDIPYTPQGPILAAEAPQSERLNAHVLRRAHLVERGHTVDKPNIAAQVFLVQITEMRIHRVVIEIDILIRIASLQPCILHADGMVMFSGRQLAVLRFQDPVIAVIRDRADHLLVRDDIERGLQILLEPVLRRHRTRLGSRIVLVIIHQHNAVGRCGNRRVVIFGVVRLQRNVKLHAAAMQVCR